MSFKKALLDVIIMDDNDKHLISRGHIDRIKENNTEIKKLKSLIENLKSERDIKIEMCNKQIEMCNKQIEKAENELTNYDNKIKISYNDLYNLILCNMDDDDFKKLILY